MYSHLRCSISQHILGCNFLLSVSSEDIFFFPCFLSEIYWDFKFADESPSHFPGWLFAAVSCHSMEPWETQCIVIYCSLSFGQTLFHVQETKKTMCLLLNHVSASQSFPWAGEVKGLQGGFIFLQKFTRRSNKWSKGSNTKCLKVTQHGQGSLCRAPAIYIKKGKMSKGKVKVGFNGKESELQWGQQKQRIEWLLYTEKTVSWWNRECTGRGRPRAPVTQSVLLKSLAVILRVIKSLWKLIVCGITRSTWESLLCSHHEERLGGRRAWVDEGCVEEV